MYLEQVEFASFGSGNLTLKTLSLLIVPKNLGVLGSD